MSNLKALPKALDMLEAAIGTMTPEQMLAAVGNVEALAPNFGDPVERTVARIVRVSDTKQAPEYEPLTEAQFRAWISSKRAMLAAHPYVAQ